MAGTNSARQLQTLLLPLLLLCLCAVSHAIDPKGELYSQPPSSPLKPILHEYCLYMLYERGLSLYPGHEWIQHKSTVLTDVCRAADPDSVAPATISVCGSDATAALFSSSQKIRTLLANSWGLGLSNSNFTSSLTGKPCALWDRCSNPGSSAVQKRQAHAFTIAFGDMRGDLEGQTSVWHKMLYPAGSLQRTTDSWQPQEAAHSRRT